MNVLNEQSITLDLRSNKPVPYPTFIQQDTNILHITILDNGVTADLTNVKQILINVKRTDGVVLTHLVSAIGNIVTYTMSGADMEVAGACEVEVQLYSGDELENKLTTRKFKINLLKAIGTVEVSEVTPEVTILNTLIDKVNKAGKSIDGGSFLDNPVVTGESIDGGEF